MNTHILIKKLRFEINFISNFLISLIDELKKQKIIEKYLVLGDKKKKCAVLLSKGLTKSRFISPQYYLKYKDINEYEKNLLPAKNKGCILLSTSLGACTSEFAKSKKIGGRIIAYVY